MAFKRGVSGREGLGSGSYTLVHPCHASYAIYSSCAQRTSEVLRRHHDFSTSLRIQVRLYCLQPFAHYCRVQNVACSASSPVKES